MTEMTDDLIRRLRLLADRLEQGDAPAAYEFEEGFHADKLGGPLALHTTIEVLESPDRDRFGVAEHDYFVGQCRLLSQ